MIYSCWAKEKKWAVSSSNQPKVVPFFLTRTAEQQAKEIVGELSESFDSREDLASCESNLVIVTLSCGSNGHTSHTIDTLTKVYDSSLLVKTTARLCTPYSLISLHIYLFV
jgi:hypothetical protein